MSLTGKEEQDLAAEVEAMLEEADTRRALRGTPEQLTIFDRLPFAVLKAYLETLS